MFSFSIHSRRVRRLIDCDVVYARTDPATERVTHRRSGFRLPLRIFFCEIDAGRIARSRAACSFFGLLLKI